MLWAFASIGFFHEEFFVGVAGTSRSWDMQPQQVANLMWALTRLQSHHSAVQETVLAHLPKCGKMIDSFRPQELSSVVLAAAKCFGHMGSNPEESPTVVPEQVVQFFNTATPWVVHRLNFFSGQSLANLVASFLAVHVGLGTEFFTAIEGEVLARVASVENLALLLLLRNLPAAPSCNLAVRALFTETAHRLDGFTAKEEEVLVRTCFELMDMPEDQEVTREWLSFACEKIGNEGLPEKTRAGFENLFAENIQTQAAALQGETVEKSSTLNKNLGLSVKNTFLHVEEEGLEEDPFDASLLPPSLDIIPESVSQEELATFRANYQNFRSGSAVGAKGEISSISEGEVSSDISALDLAVPPHHVKPSPSLWREENTGSSAHRCHPVELSRIDETGSSVSGSEVSSGNFTQILPPPLDFMPHYIPLEKLQTFRENYQRFRAGQPVGAKGEFSSIAENTVSEKTEELTTFTRLPPPLRIVPPDVSNDKLTAYRVNYQRFRAGMAVGAKGELTEVPMVDTTSTDEAEVASVTSSDLSNCLKPKLLPPLDVVLQFADSAELQAYRMDYQKFRMGHSDGAVGEVTSVASGAKVSVSLEKALSLPKPLHILPRDIPLDQLMTWRLQYQKFRAVGTLGAKGEV